MERNVLFEEELRALFAWAIKSNMTLLDLKVYGEHLYNSYF